MALSRPAVVLGTDLVDLESNNDYIVEDQRRLPDLVLDLAPVRTGRIDLGRKREFRASCLAGTRQLR